MKPANSYTKVEGSPTNIQFANGFVLQCKVRSVSGEGIQVVDSEGKTYKFLSALLSKATLNILGITQ